MRSLSSCYVIVLHFVLSFSVNFMARGSEAISGFEVLMEIQISYSTTDLWNLFQ